MLPKDIGDIHFLGFHSPLRFMYTFSFTPLKIIPSWLRFAVTNIYKKSRQDT